MLVPELAWGRATLRWPRRRDGRERGNSVSESREVWGYKVVGNCGCYADAGVRGGTDYLLLWELRTHFLAGLERLLWVTAAPSWS